MKKEIRSPQAMQNPAPGSLINKFPVVLEDGKTIVFISDKNKENAIRLKYARHAEDTITK
jgi:hypothetical protein